jgi:hypothetical protein
MKASPFLIFLVAVSLNSLTTVGQAQDGLIDRYLLNGNAVDSAGTLHGNVIGPIPTIGHSGGLNTAYAFDGIDDRIEFIGPPLFNQNESWTISIWVNPSNFTQNAMMIYIGFDNGAASDGYGLGLNNGPTVKAFLPSTGGFVDSGAPFSGLGLWTHIVMMRTNGVISFYVNGVKAPNTSTATHTAPSDFTIGSQNGTRFFKGALDDVRIYKRAISTNEVAQLYTGVDGPCYPHAAAAFPILFNGFVVGATVTDSACGYTNAPTVTISGGGGSNATATATISNGMVTAINIVNAGCCYTNEPRIIISSPPFPTSVSIRVSRVMVTQHVMVGRTYVLEGSSDLNQWVTIGDPFVAQTEIVDTEVVVDTYHFYRTREITP